MLILRDNLTDEFSCANLNDCPVIGVINDELVGILNNLVIIDNDLFNINNNITDIDIEINNINNNIQTINDNLIDKDKFDYVYNAVYKSPYGKWLCRWWLYHK